MERSTERAASDGRKLEPAGIGFESEPETAERLVHPSGNHRMLRCNMMSRKTAGAATGGRPLLPGGRVAAIDCAERARLLRSRPAEGNLSFIGDPSAGNDLVPRATDFIGDIGTGAAHRSDRPGEVGLHRRG